MFLYSFVFGTRHLSFFSGLTDPPPHPRFSTGGRFALYF